MSGVTLDNEVCSDDACICDRADEGIDRCRALILDDKGFNGSLTVEALSPVQISVKPRRSDYS